MKLWIWITRWIIFYIRYSRLKKIYLKKHEQNIDNSSIRLYVNKTENSITFKIKTRYYFELLTPERMKLLGIIENEITK